MIPLPTSWFVIRSAAASGCAATPPVPTAPPAPVPAAPIAPPRLAASPPSLIDDDEPPAPRPAFPGRSSSVRLRPHDSASNAASAGATIIDRVTVVIIRPFRRLPALYLDSVTGDQRSCSEREPRHEGDVAKDRIDPGSGIEVRGARVGASDHHRVAHCADREHAGQVSSERERPH